MLWKGVINRLCHGKGKSHRDVTSGSWKCSLYWCMNLGWFTVPTGPPQNFVVTPGARSMTFSWAPPNATQRNGVITGYSLSCTPLTAEGDITMQYTQVGTFTLGGFTPFTIYSCSIFASNHQGDGPMALIDIPTEEDCKLPFQFANVSACLYTAET